MAFNPKNLSVMYQAGNPFAGDPPDADGYYAAIGRIVVLWGRFEQVIEWAIWMMSVLPDSPKPQQPPPVSFKRKLERLKELCRDTPSLSHARENVRNFASKAAVLSRKRHDLTHANWQGFDPRAPEPTVQFSNIRWDSPHGTQDKRPISLSDLETLLTEIVQINEILFSEVFNESMRVMHRAFGKFSEQA